MRRAEDTVGDIELVAAVDDPAAVVAAIAHAPSVDRLLLQSPRRVYLLVNRAQVGVRLPEVARAGSVLLHLTGSPAHFRALQARAEERGWQLTPDGFRRRTAPA